MRASGRQLIEIRSILPLSGTFGMLAYLGYPFTRRKVRLYEVAKAWQILSGASADRRAQYGN